MANKRSQPNTGTGAVARHRVRDGIREMILSGAFAPGAKLSQVHLARIFGVSQGVIRESLLELRAVGLVEAVDNFGVFVSSLDAEKLIQAYEVREMLEGLAARLCCERVARADLRELAAMAERVYELAIEGDHEEMGLLDRQWHHRLIRISGNGMLERLSENYRVFERVIRVARDFKTIRDEHLAILKAIEQNLTDEAERLMREHVRAGRKAIEKQAAKGAPIFHIDGAAPEETHS